MKRSPSGAGGLISPAGRYVKPDYFQDCQTLVANQKDVKMLLKRKVDQKSLVSKLSQARLQPDKRFHPYKPIHIRDQLAQTNMSSFLDRDVPAGDAVSAIKANHTYSSNLFK